MVLSLYTREYQAPDDEQSIHDGETASWWRSPQCTTFGLLILEKQRSLGVSQQRITEVDGKLSSMK